MEASLVNQATWYPLSAVPETLVKPLNQTMPLSMQQDISYLPYFGVRCWAQFHGSIAMNRIKTSLRNTMTDERLSSLSILHIYNVVNVTKFTQQKGRLLALCL